MLFTSLPLPSFVFPSLPHLLVFAPPLLYFYSLFTPPLSLPPSLNPPLSPTIIIVVMNSLKELSTKTSILSDPSQVPHQLVQYAKQQLETSQQDYNYS